MVHCTYLSVCCQWVLHKLVCNLYKFANYTVWGKRWLEFQPCGPPIRQQFFVSNRRWYAARWELLLPSLVQGRHSVTFPIRLATVPGAMCSSHLTWTYDHVILSSKYTYGKVQYEFARQILLHSLSLQFHRKMRCEQRKMCIKLKLHYHNYYSDCVQDRESALIKVPLKHAKLLCGVR